MQDVKQQTSLTVHNLQLTVKVSKLIRNLDRLSLSHRLKYRMLVCTT